MNEPTPLHQVLHTHLALCRELLSVVEQEHRALTDPRPPCLAEFSQARKRLLPRLEQSLHGLQKHRGNRRDGARAEPPGADGVGALLRQCQETTMRILLLDRQNEQSLLRRGLVPVRELAFLSGQRPEVAAGLYQRQNPR